MHHRFIISLLVYFSVTQLYANDSNTTQKKEDIKAVVLYQGKEVYDTYLKQKKEDKLSSFKEITSSENNVSDALKVHSALKPDAR